MTKKEIAATLTDEEITAKVKAMRKAENAAYYQRNKETIKKKIAQKRREKAINALIYEHMKAEQENAAACENGGV